MNQKISNYIVQDMLHNTVLNAIIVLAYQAVFFGTKYDNVLKSLKISLIDEAIKKYKTRREVCSALGITRRILEYNLNGKYKENSK